MIAFAGNPLNRLSDRRSDAAWIAEMRRTARILPLWRLQPLLTRGDASAAVLLPPEIVEPLAAPGAVCVFLGLDGEEAVFALDISASQNPMAALEGLGAFHELRGAAAALAPRDLAIAGQAKAVIDWHARHGHCARCGAPTLVAEAGWRRDCPSCQTQHFPRTDPAVIMLPVHGEECLLARNVKWSGDFYSALAGFVEPGESFEEAVRRELFEEAGVVAGKVTYVGSQPWPFPASIMIGFFAECASKDLRLDPHEIAEAEWFDRVRALALLNGEIPGRRGPMKAAIAHHLVRSWAEAS